MEEVDKFIKHTIVNLHGALDKHDDKLTLAVLTNLEHTIGSYIDALEMSDLYDTIGN